MTNTIYNDIRAALETTLAAVSGIPTLVEYDGVEIDPPTDTAYAVATISNQQRRPATMGTGPQQLYEGLFSVTLRYPVGKGAGDIEAMAYAIVAAFPVDATITQGSALLRIRYAELAGQARIDSGLWLAATVNIAWYVYNT